MIAHVPNPFGLTTIEQIAEANPGWKVEREADGSFTMSPPNGSLSGTHEMALYKILIDWNEKADGQLFSSAKLQHFRGCGATYVLLIDPFRRRTWSEGTPPPDFPTDFTSVFDAGMQ